MKINESGRIQGVNPYQRSNVENRDNQVSKKKQVDQVSISAEAKFMLEEVQRVQDPKRAERIEQLKEAVNTGVYQVSADKVAEKLLPFFKSFAKGDNQ